MSLGRNNMSKDLSIIITCYNEKRLLPGAIQQLISLFDKTKLDYEIVIVDDYSTDGSKEIILDLSKKYPVIRFLMHQHNMGRGKSVADGVRFSEGNIVGFIDMDFATDPVYILKLYSVLVHGADIATARRYYKLDRNSIKILHRYILHKGYKALIKLAFRTPIRDTETGCKFFRRESLLTYIDEIDESRQSNWFWDTEVMIRGYYRGMKIVEVPTLFVRRPETGSTMKLARDVGRYLHSFMRFRKEVKKLKRSGARKGVVIKRSY